MDQSECLVIEDVHKQMGVVKALNGVSLSVRAGTIHGVIGHNGSGKSTLVKVLSGVLPADSGTYEVRTAGSGTGSEGRPPRVATVFQDLGLADNLSVFENILVNSFETGRAGFVHVSRERARARSAMSALGLDLPMDLEAWKLPEPERVMVCVIRALMHGGVALRGDTASSELGSLSADILLLDEPTSALPREELERFRALIRGLVEGTGMTALVVTHNPGDIGALCDEFTALKSGEVICTLSAEGVTGATVAELMAGRAMVMEDGVVEVTEVLSSSASEHPRKEQVLVVEELTSAELSAPVSLSVGAGELVGVTGLEGSGFREFVEAAMGIRDVASGSVQVDGRPLTGGPSALHGAKAVYIPADRARTSGVPSATVYENMTLGQVDGFCHFGLLRSKAEKAAVKAMLEQLRVDPPDPKRILGEMSGGQQQKVMVGRALLAGAKLLVFDEPTAAVDVGAREEILGYLKDVALAGSAVIMASAEFEWMPAVCDRIVVFRSGEVAGELLAGAMTEDGILRLAYGD